MVISFMEDNTLRTGLYTQICSYSDFVKNGTKIRKFTRIFTPKSDQIFLAINYIYNKYKLKIFL